MLEFFHPFYSQQCVHPLCGLGQAGRATHPDRLNVGPMLLAVGKCSAVSHASAGFVLSFLRPALVFPEAWNLKINNWGLSLKAVSGGERVGREGSSLSCSSTWQTHIRWVSDSILMSCQESTGIRGP